MRCWSCEAGYIFIYDTREINQELISFYSCPLCAAHYAVKKTDLPVVMALTKEYRPQGKQVSMVDILSLKDNPSQFVWRAVEMPGVGTDDKFFRG